MPIVFTADEQLPDLTSWIATMILHRRTLNTFLDLRNVFILCCVQSIEPNQTHKICNSLTKQRKSLKVVFSYTALKENNSMVKWHYFIALAVRSYVSKILWSAKITKQLSQIHHKGKAYVGFAFNIGSLKLALYLATRILFLTQKTYKSSMRIIYELLRNQLECMKHISVRVRLQRFHLFIF